MWPTYELTGWSPCILTLLNQKWYWHSSGIWFKASKM